MNDDDPKTLSVPTAGKRYFGLGKNASYDAARRGDIPTIKIGSRLRVPIIALERMLAEAGPKNWPSSEPWSANSIQRRDHDRVADSPVRSLGLTWSDIIAPAPSQRAPIPRTAADWQRMRHPTGPPRAGIHPLDAFRRDEPTERQSIWLVDIYTDLHRVPRR
jgi:hypothetical protein